VAHVERVHRGRNKAERLIHWCYYHMDLYGDDGHPSYHKVLGAVGFFFALLFCIVEGIMLVTREIQPDMSFTTLFLGVLAIPMGRGVFVRALGGIKTVPGPAPKEDLP